MLDGCENIGNEEFEQSMNFTKSLASSCSVSKSKAQFGCSVYSYENKMEHDFSETTNYDSFANSVDNIEKPKGNLININK